MMGDDVKKAVALSYNPDEEAPKVVASGSGYVAEKIINTAKENNIHIHRDPDLAKLLNYVEIGQYIPQTLYEIVAKVLTFVGDIDKIFKRKK